MKNIFKIFVIVPALLCMYTHTEQTPEVSYLDDTHVFAVRAETMREAYNQLFYRLGNAKFHKDGDYPVTFPEHPLFKDLEEHPEKLQSIDKEEYFSVFAQEVYEPTNSDLVFENLKQHSECLLEIDARLKKLTEAWGFKSFEQYTIIAEKYNPGSSCNTNGIIYLKANCTTETMWISVPSMTILIGILEDIVLKYNLTFWEKIGLMDHICETYLGDLLPDYAELKSQEKDDKKIKEFITLEDICTDLPTAIEKYIEQYPR